MSAVLSRRIAALEAKRLKEEGPHTFYVIGTRFPDRIEELSDGTWRRNPCFTEESFAAFCREQQRELLAKCAELAAQLDQDVADDTQAPHVGIATERAPRPAGQKANALHSRHNAVAKMKLKR